jgi:hypothetical protein
MARYLITFLLLIATPPFAAFALPPQDFLLFYSNDVNGEIEPCG